MIQGIFIDIDGTLVSLKTHRAHPKDVVALKKAKAAGVKLFVATGRHIGVREEGYVLDGLYDLFDGFVCTTGQYCFTADGYTVLKNSINPEDVKAVVQMTRKHQIPCTYADEKNLYINMVNDRVIEHNKKIQLPIPPVREMQESDEMLSITLYMTPEEEQNLLKPLLHHSNTVSWMEGIVDILPKSGGKMSGIRAMADYFGIGLDEIMAIGDSSNDLDMILAAAIGVATADAPQELKKHSNFVTSVCEEAGIEKALLHFGVIT